jgi:hypothetical protein
MWRLVCFALIAACTTRGDFGADANRPDADPNNPFPPPRTDLVPAIGSESTLEIATWNIENFPGAPSTPAVVADLIASMDLDVVVCEEIADESAWNELLLRLRDHEGVLSTHVYTPTEYQKVGVIYRSALVTAGEPTLLFQSDEFVFPRPPLKLPITVDDDTPSAQTIELIGVHLKAGVSFEDAQRRRDAIIALDGHMRFQIDNNGEPDIVLLGDYNERVIDAQDRAVLAPILTAPERYTMRTAARHRPELPLEHQRPPPRRAPRPAIGTVFSSLSCDLEPRGITSTNGDGVKLQHRCRTATVAAT